MGLGTAAALTALCGARTFAADLQAEVSDARIQHVEVVQSIQDDANDVPLVAGKPTVVRVFATVTGEGTLQGVSASLLGRALDGTSLPGSPMVPANGPIEVGPAHSRGDADSSLNFFLPQAWLTGSVHLTARLALPLGFADGQEENNATSLTVTFAPSRTLDLCYALVDYRSPTWAPPTLPRDRVRSQQAADWLRAVFPLAWTDIRYTSWRPRVLLFGSSDPLGGALLTFLRTAWASTPDHCCDQLYAWTPRKSYRSNGLSDRSSERRVAFGNDTGLPDQPTGWMYRRTLAHEVAHNLGRLSHRKVTLDRDELGFDTGVVDPLGRQVLQGLRDLMWPAVAEVDAWVNQETYDRLRPVNWGLPSACGDEEGLAPPASDGAGDYLVVRGAVHCGDGIELFASYKVAATPRVVTAARRQSAAGSHQIIFRNANGEPAESIGWEPDCADPDPDPLPFVWYLPYRDDITSIELVSGEDQRMELEGGDFQPEIQLDRLGAALESLGDDQSPVLAWRSNLPEIHDLSRGTFEHQVWFSRDAGVTWQIVAAGIDATSVELDLGSFPGCDRCRLKVSASTRFRVAEDLGPEFSLPDRPPTATILSPPGQSTTRAGLPVHLAGFAEDPETGLLPEDRLSWWSDLDGLLGTGAQLIAPRLSLGVHSIRLEAVDPDGKEATSLPILITVTGHS